MIRLEGVTRTYGSDTSLVTALNGVDLEVGAGEYVAIMGTSGSGKSTMMNIIGCLDRPSEGDYLFEGLEVGRLPDRDRARLRGRVFGFVFQSYNLLPRLTALEQVELPLVYQQAPNRRRRAAEALIRVGLRDRIHHRPSELSGGEQQRVAIARSLVVNPRLVLADEPTGALDTHTGEEVMELLTELVEDQGITVILVTHEQEVADYAHRVIRMRDAQIIEDTTQIPHAGISHRGDPHVSSNGATQLDPPPIEGKPIAPRPLGVDDETLRRAASSASRSNAGEIHQSFEEIDRDLDQIERAAPDRPARSIKGIEA